MAARVPLADIPENVRERVRQVIDQPTLIGQGPTEVFAGHPGVYTWLLDHPDRGVRAWRRLGAKCTEITDHGEGCFGWTDGYGSEIRWRTVYDTASVRIWYAEGKVRPSLLLPPIPLRIVVLLTHGQRQDGSGRPLLTHQAEAFFQTDSKTAVLVTRMLGASAPRLIEQGLEQVELFFSGLAWYLDHHPERAEKLLADNRGADKMAR
jgi:hypothetical protein